MSKINQAVHDIHHIHAMATQDQWLNRLHPLAKLVVTFTYILTVVSFTPYDIIGLAAMSIYIIATMILADISIKQSLKQVRMVLIMVCIVGIVNPFIDQTKLGSIGSIVITGGVISMLSLMLKGIFAVLASYLLIVTTSIEKICYALRCLHVPKGFVTLVLLIYRYIIVLLKETHRITQAYQLRAPNQKGIHIKAWGTLVGQLLLRSIDRAQVVYESMILRGYDGEFHQQQKEEANIRSIIYCMGWLGIIALFRSVPVFEIVGSILT